MGFDAVAPAQRSAGWTCSACDYVNQDGLTCDRCGVARRWLENPPLDLPPQPGWFERPAAWLSLLHVAGLGLGAVLLIRPETAPWLALAAPVQAIQVGLSAAATLAAVNRAATERILHEVFLDVPDRAAAGQTIVADARLVPYARIERATVTLELVENTYERTRGRNGRTNIRTRSRRLERYRLVRGASLPGRRPSLFEASFVAPYPSEGLRDVGAELKASVLGALAWLVPGLGEAARNLREHGGVWARLTVRVGPFRRRVDRRITVFQLVGDEIRAG